MGSDPFQVFLQVVGSLVGVLALRYLDRRKNRKVQSAAEDAATFANSAADQATTAVAQANRAVDRTQATHEVNEDTAHTLRFLRDSAESHGAAMERMAEQLVLSKQAQDQMARRNDDVLAALLKELAVSRGANVATRLRRLEQFAAERETEEHITGRLRLQ